VHEARIDAGLRTGAETRHFNSDLVDDILSIASANLSLRDLASTSLVAKTWQAAAFPCLYHTGCLTLARHLENLAKRITSNDNGPLSIQVHVRALDIDKNYNKLKPTDGYDCRRKH
jgi:hypothetical protein